MIFYTLSMFLRKFNFLILIPFLLFSLKSYSQDNFVEKWFSADSEHLPQNSVKNIFKDKYGFIWIATENGIVRYDGSNFKTYSSKSLKVNSSRIFNFFGFISSDSIFAGTDNKNDLLLINKRNPSKLKRINASIKNEQLFTCSYLKNLDGVSEFKIENIKLFNEIENYYVIKENKINLFSKKNQLLKIFNHNFSIDNYYFFLEENLICLDDLGNYTVFSQDREIKNRIPVDSNTKIIINPINKQVFLYTKNSISILQFKNEKLQETNLYSSEKKFDFTIFSLFYESNSGKLFIGTTNKGLKVVTKKAFNVLFNNESFDNNYYALEKIDEKTFLTARGELFSTNKFIEDLNVNPSREQYSIAIDNNKNIWLKSSSLLIKFLKSHNYSKHEYYDFELDISTIYFSKKTNSIWVGFKENDKKKYLASIKLNNLSTNIIDPFFINGINEEIVFINENEKDLILNSNKSLFFYSKKTKSLIKIKTPESQIRSTYISNDKKLWICTYNNGFSLYENNIFHKIPIDKESFLTSSHSIQEDVYGYFWIPTNNGLVQVRESDLLNYIKTKREIYFYHYDKNDGFLTNEFNGGCQPNSIKFKNGYIVFPSLNGVVSFNPLYTKRIIPKNDFFINEVDLDGKKYFLKNYININRSVNQINFHVDFAYLGNDKNVDFKTKLLIEDEEENSKWISLPNNRILNYTNLPPGKHILYVKKINGYLSEDNTKKIIINVPFYFYEKLWFKFLIIFTISLIVFLLLRVRYNFIKNKNLELEKIVNERTKELNSLIENLYITKKICDIN